MHTEMGGPTLRSVEQVGSEEYIVHVTSGVDNKPYRLMVQLRPSDALIGSLGVEQDN
jgi:hypothetical protein